MTQRGNLETILGVVGAISAASLLGIISYKIATSKNKAEIDAMRAEKSAPPPNPTQTKRPFGEVLDLFYDGSPEERCAILENDILPMSFHNDCCEFLVKDSRFCHQLLALFTQPPGSVNEEKQRRLAGWILGSLSFNHTGQTALPMMKVPQNNVPFLQYIHDEIQQISNNSSSEILATYDIGNPLQSPFLSMLQMLVNFSSNESNLEIMVDSGSIEVVCAIVTKILSEDDNEKLLIHLLRTLINCALAIQALPIPRTPGQIYTQRSIQNTCHQVSNAPHSEQIADRLEKIQSAFNE